MNANRALPGALGPALHGARIQSDSTMKSAVDGPAPGGAVGGLSRQELLTLLSNPAVMNSRTDRDAILAPDNLFRYFDVIVAGEDHTTDAGNRWLFASHQSMGSDVAIFSERLPRGTDNAKIADMATDAGATPVRTKHFFFRAASSEISLHDAGRTVHGIESCPMTRLAFELALQGDALYQSLSAPHPGKTTKQVLGSGMTQLCERMATSPVLTKIAEIEAQLDVRTGTNPHVVELRENLTKIADRQMVIAKAAGALHNTQTLDDVLARSLVMKCRRATLQLHFQLQDVTKSIFMLGESQTRNAVSAKLGRLNELVNIGLASKTLALLEDLQSRNRLDQNGPFVEAIAEKYAYAATDKVAAPKAFVIVGAAHMLEAIDGNGSPYEGVGVHLAKRCGVPAERILNVVLGNAANYGFDFHRSEGYTADSACAILPGSVWKARMPVLDRAAALAAPLAPTV
jgi:hypothetical protein